MSSLDLKFLKTKPYKVHRSYGKYQNFWQRIATPTTASSYLSELISKVMYFEAYKKSLKQDDLIELEMISVMYGMALNYQIGDLNRAKVDDKLKKIEPQAQHPFIQKIISNIYKLLIDREDIIGSVISQACFAREFAEDPPLRLNPDVIAYYKSIKQLSDHANPVYQALRVKDVEILDTGEFSFLYEHVVKYLKNNKKQMTKELYQGILNTAKTVKLGLRENPDSAQIAACALIHVIRQILTFYPISEVDMLKEFGSILEMFRKWPLPAGLMADSCFKIIMSELRSPGAMLRDNLRDNFPLLDFVENEGESVEEALRHIVYCIIEDSLEIDDILSCTNYHLEAEPNLDPHQTRALLISYVLSNVVGSDRASIFDLISGLSVYEVFMIYTRIVHILEKTTELSNISDSKNLQKSAFEELLKEVANATQITSSKTSVVKAFKENPTLIAPFPSAQFITLNKVIDRLKDSAAHKRSSSFSFANPKQAIKEQMNNIARSQYTSVWENIRDIIEHTKRPEMPMHEEPVKFMVVGGEAELFGFVQDLLGVFNESPHLFRRIDLRVYIVPTSYSAIAQYLAAHDFWYQRYVYVPFKSNPIIPKIEYTGRSQTESQPMGKSLNDINMTDKRGIFPALIKESMMQTYVREAYYKFPPIVYQVKCYASLFEETKAEEPNKVFYFFQYVDIGASVMRYKQKIEKKLAPDTPFYELESNKLIKKFYLDLKIKAEYSELSGYTHKSEEVVVRSIHDMSINNIPREYTKGALPYPTSGWLEVAYLDFENYKAEDNAMKDKDRFKKTRPEHINAAFSALYTNIHVKRISVWTDNKDQTFEFVADGTLCGPCRRIDISPVIMNNYLSDPYFTLPIMTFFPVQM